MKGLKIPKELKKALAEKDLSFKKWCENYGFNRTTALMVLNQQIKNLNAPKSKEITNALKRDFPELFKNKSTLNKSDRR
jgi:hypothetical protein